MIKLENVSTGYTKDRVLLYNYNRTFEDGKIYAIMGHSGCGKTTLLKTISGLIEPVSGNIYVDGSAVKNASCNVFMMNQTYTSFDWLTCRDNILIIDKVKKEKITDEKIKEANSLLDSVGLPSYQNVFPSKLSGGEKQRLALARAMYAKPKHLLMDEPLSALDENTRGLLRIILKCFNKEQKNTIIMVTHSREEAEKIADEIIYLQ